MARAYNYDGTVKDFVGTIQARASIRRQVLDRQSTPGIPEREPGTPLSHNELARLQYAEKIGKFLK